MLRASVQSRITGQRVCYFERAATFYTLVRSARLNGIEPEAWLTDLIARVGAHPINRLAELLPWNWQPSATRSVAA